MSAVLLSLGLGVAGCCSDVRDRAREPREVVLVLHGMGRTSLSMAPMVRCINQAGFDARTWSYPSLSVGTDELAERLRSALVRLDADRDVSRIHLVGHSLGGIVARAALLPEPPAKMGRLVLLAPPNKGSPVARVLAPYLGRWILPLPELSDAPESLVRRLKTLDDVEIGVIAASHDGKVPVKSTHLEGESDHLVVPGFHTFLMNQQQVQREVVHFLRHGRFSHTD